MMEAGLTVQMEKPQRPGTRGTGKGEPQPSRKAASFRSSGAQGAVHTFLCARHMGAGSQHVSLCLGAPGPGFPLPPGARERKAAQGRPHRDPGQS